MSDDAPPQGVQALDHTADVGIEVTAPDLSTLFARAALGGLWLAMGCSVEGRGQVRELELEAEDLPALLRSWVREVLYWHEVEGFAAAGVEVEALEAGEGDGAARIRARLQGGPAPPDPAREIKGVTWHGLVLEPVDAPGARPGEGGWRARVIFDV